MGVNYKHSLCADRVYALSLHSKTHCKSRYLGNCWHNLNYLGINVHCEYTYLSFASYMDDSVLLSSSFYFFLYHFHPNWHLSNSAHFIHFYIVLISELFLFWEIFSFTFSFWKSFWFISIWWTRAQSFGLNYKSSHCYLIKTLLLHYKEDISWENGDKENKDSGKVTTLLCQIFIKFWSSDILFFICKCF